MANTQSNDITRTANANTLKTEVAIYLNRDVLMKIIDEYVTLKGVMEDWHNRFEKNKDDILKNSSGNATTAFWNEHIDFDHYCFYDMLIDMRTAVPILEEASIEAKALLLRCEDFYEILLGGGSYAQCSKAVTTVGDYYFNTTNILPMTPILFYNPVYYGGAGKMGIYTDEANAKFGEISDANNELKTIIDSIETEGLSINEEYSAIDDECIKRGRLIALYDSFAEYVNGVNQFNKSKSEKFEKIWVQENDLSYQYPRKYDYSYVTDEKQKAALSKVFIHQVSSTNDCIQVNDSNRVKIGKVSDTFIKVTGVPEIDDNGVPTGNLISTYGGNQDWLKDFLGVERFGTMGCGVIASVNQYLYLTGQTTITYEEYKKLAYDFLLANDQILPESKITSIIGRHVMILGPLGGAAPWQMSEYIQNKCLSQGVIVSSSWDYKNDYEDDYENMKKQLEKGIPAIWAVHNFDEKNIHFLEYDSSKGQYIYDLGKKIGSAASSHYIIATGIYEDVDDTGKLRRMIEVSSLGEKYYVDYDQYIDVVSKNQYNKPFSSVMNTMVVN